MLSNIYLHEVLDEWFTQQFVPRLVGRAVLIRYGDDAVIIFAQERDAQRSGWCAAENRDFAYSQASNIVESDRLPLFLRQRLNRAPQHLVDLLGLVNDLRRWFLIFEREWGNGFPANKVMRISFPQQSQPITAQVRRNSQKPGTKAVLVSKFVQVEQGGEESFLHHIFRVESIEQSCRKTQSFGAVTVNEISKGSFLTPQQPSHDLVVIRDGHLPRCIVASRAKKVAYDPRAKPCEFGAGPGFAKK
jgi:hypothetical protein